MAHFWVGGSVTEGLSSTRIEFLSSVAEARRNIRVLPSREIVVLGFVVVGGRRATITFRAKMGVLLHVFCQA